MEKMAKFDTKDLDLLETVVDCVPNLRAVAHAVRLARRHCHYPIKGQSDLQGAFDSKPHVDLGDRKISREECELFIPAAFFPIESERDLACKLLIAFRIGDNFHETDSYRAEIVKQATEKADDIQTTMLPGPVYHSVTRKELIRAKQHGG